MSSDPPKKKYWDIDPHGPTPPEDAFKKAPPPDPVGVDFTDNDLIVWLFELARNNRAVYLQVRDVGVQLIEEFKKRSVIPD